MGFLLFLVLFVTVPTPIPIKEMTYLFLVIGVSVVNALANKKISHAELIFANLMIVFVTFGMERIWLLKGESRKNVSYITRPNFSKSPCSKNQSKWEI